MPTAIVIVGSQGRVEADIHAREVVVGGVVKGSIVAGERVELKNTARIAGDVRTSRISIEDGASLNGSIDIFRRAVSLGIDSDVSPTTTEPGRAFTLLFFLDECLLPELKEWEETTSADKPTLRQVQASVLEAFLWLALGAEMQIFPIASCSQIVPGLMSQFFDSLALTEREKTFGRSQNIQLGELVSLFPESDITIRSAVEQRILRLPDTRDFPQDGRLAAAFNSLLLGYSRLSRDRNAQLFMRALNFWDSGRWERVSRQHVSSEEVIEASKTGDGSETKARLCSGFFRTLHHLEVFRDGCLSFIDSDKSTPGAWSLLRRVRQIHAWRLNIRNPETQQRLSALTDELNRYINEEMKTLGIRTTNDVFRASIDELTEFWVPERAMLATV